MTKLFAVLILLLLDSCVMEPHYDDRLVIVNKSSKTICVDYEMDTILYTPSLNKKEFFIRERINPEDSNRIESQGSRDQWVFDVSHGKDSTLSIFVFDYEQVLVTDWDTLRTNKKYKRLDYKLTDLNKINWTVIVQ